VPNRALLHVVSVRAYAWQVILAESGPVNAVLGGIGLGPFTMLNSGFGAMIGYLTLVLPLVVIFQTWSLAAIDRSLIEAAGNLAPLRFGRWFQSLSRRRRPALSLARSSPLS
jgi:ABC-type spermidine/putrescine transport system permease subunit I